MHWVTCITPWTPLTMTQFMYPVAGVYAIEEAPGILPAPQPLLQKATCLLHVPCHVSKHMWMAEMSQGISGGSRCL